MKFTRSNDGAYVYVVHTGGKFIGLVARDTEDGKWVAAPVALVPGPGLMVRAVSASRLGPYKTRKEAAEALVN